MNTMPAAPAVRLAGGFRGVSAGSGPPGLPGAPSRGAAGPPPLLSNCRRGDFAADAGHGDSAWSAPRPQGLLHWPAADRRVPV